VKKVASLTLVEQVSLLAGASFWLTPEVTRAGVPALKVTDGPNGARGGGALVSGVSAACFPAAIALASSWDPALLGEVGAALAEEARSKGAHALLAPTVNLHRGPLNGRNFECYSEDPLLTAQLAVAYICGLQSRGVGATIKHFVGNESEFERMSISSEIPERALCELYLLPFEAAVDAGVWAVMCAYNKLGGVYAS
jgi:beta-glucosidase